MAMRHLEQPPMGVGMQKKDMEHTPLAPYSSISTERIMRAVQQQQRIVHQIEDLRKQQMTRVQHLRPAGAAIAALGLFTLCSIPLLLLALMIVQTNLAVQVLALLNNTIDLLMIIAQYIQTGLLLVTRNTWLLSGLALAVVIMTGMWLRLMRPPREISS